MCNVQMCNECAYVQCADVQSEPVAHPYIPGEQAAREAKLAFPGVCITGQTVRMSEVGVEPATRGRKPALGAEGEALIAKLCRALRAMKFPVVRQCKLDPSLKAPSFKL